METVTCATYLRKAKMTTSQETLTFLGTVLLLSTNAARQSDTCVLKTILFFDIQFSRIVQVGFNLQTGKNLLEKHFGFEFSNAAQVCLSMFSFGEDDPAGTDRRSDQRIKSHDGLCLFGSTIHKQPMIHIDPNGLIEQTDRCCFFLQFFVRTNVPCFHIISLLSANF